MVAGRGTDPLGAREFALARYNSDGSLDTSFSGDGKQMTDFDGHEATGVAVQQDGKIVAGGSTGSDSVTDDFALARYNTDGSLDTTFSEDGKQRTDFGPDDAVSAVALQADGRIVAAGSSDSSSGPSGSTLRDFALARYNTDGSLDTSFSGDGKQTTDFGADDPANDVVLQADGKIVAAGTAAGGSTASDFALARYKTDGSLDTSFSGDGKQMTDFGGGDRAAGVALQSDGRIVTAGGLGINGINNAFALARYNPDGSLDPSFSDDGRQTTKFSERLDSALAVAVQGDGKIVSVGEVDATLGGGFALARYEGGGPPPPPPDTTPPDTTIDSGPSGATEDATPTFGFSASETGSSFDCRVDTAAFAPCSSPHTTASLGNGAHTFDVRATDVAGNVDPTPASRSFTVSTAQPQAPGTQPQPTPIIPPFITPPSTATDPPDIGGAGSAGTLTVSSKGLLTLRRHAVDCTGSGPDCAARTSLTGSLPAGKASSSGRRRTVKLGGSSFKVKTGQRSKVKVKLTRKGLKLLKRLKRIKAKVTITAKRGAISKKKNVKVTLKAPKKKK